jgi:catechol 2,3-dioxygenase-like lactoylglutathione lyase family enzyme
LRIKAIVETALYVNDLQVAETFYGMILGLWVIGREPGGHVFFQVGEASVLLAFLAEATLKGDRLPPHGATGPGHFALGIDAEAFDAWRKLLPSFGALMEGTACPRSGSRTGSEPPRIEDSPELAKAQASVQWPEARSSSSHRGRHGARDFPGRQFDRRNWGQCRPRPAPGGLQRHPPTDPSR